MRPFTGPARRIASTGKLAKRFADRAYIADELVAEIGAAFLCAELGITQSVRADHAQYLAHWLRLLKDDTKAIFTAAARAGEAVNYLKGLQAQPCRNHPPPAELHVPSGAHAEAPAVLVTGVLP